MASCERDGPRSSSAATELHIAVVVVVVELFLTVFLGLVVEEVEEANGRQLRLRSLTRTFKLGLIGLSLAAISQKSQSIILSTVQDSNGVSLSTFSLLSPSWTISYFFYSFLP